jgi:phage major head subunit gpT-like protein
MIVNRANLSLLTQAFNAAFMEGFKLAPSMWADVALLVPSTTSEEKYAWLGATTKFREWLGDRVYQSLRQYDYAIKNKTYENTVEVPREAIEDDQYGVYKPLIGMMGEDSRKHPDELVFGLLQAGFTTTCYDGQYFFDTDHPVGLPGAEASVSNFQGGSGAAWYLIDTSHMIKPVIFQRRRDYKFQALDSLDDHDVFKRNQFIYGVDARVNVGFGLWQYAYASKLTLDATNYAAACAAMGAFKGDSGKPLAVKPTKLYVGWSNWAAAKAVVEAERLANGATNTMRNTTEVVVCPWLA